MMNIKITALLVIIGVVSFSCNQKRESENISKSQEPIVFAKGKQITNDNFTGTVWLENLIEADNINQNAVGSVTFEPDARSRWHIHPAGQMHPQNPSMQR